MQQLPMADAPTLSLGVDKTKVDQAEGFRPTPFWKRSIDVAGAVLGLAALSPFLALVAIFIKVVSPGPIFFRQRRVGARGELFTIWKFRTMRSQTDAGLHRQYVGELTKGDTPLSKLDDSEHLIRLGAFLRRSSLDELPQLINILLGDMSLVGPRPDVLALDDYTPQQRRRFDVAPGLTGLWQVSGKNRTTFDEMIALDLRYVTQRSLALDLWIMLRTLPLLLGLNR